MALVSGSGGTEAVQFRPSADVKLPIGDRRCGDAFLLHVVLCQHFQLRSPSQDHHLAILTRDVDLAVTGYRLGQNRAGTADALFVPEKLALAGPEAADKTTTFEEQHPAIIRERRYQVVGGP